MRQAKVGLKMLMERRARDDSSKLYQTAADEDAISRERANFETRSCHHYEAKEIRRRALQRQEEAEIALDERRSRLYTLLAGDEDRYAAEIERSFETPVQRRGRLQERLATIRAQKEREHAADVEQRLYNRWVEECDPLRAQISRAVERHVARERDAQIVEQDLARREADAAEEAHLAAVYEGVREFRERQEREEADRLRKQAQNRYTWNAQIGRHRDDLIREQQRDREEGARARQRHEEDVRAAADDDVRRRRDQTARRRELDALNEDQVTRRRRADEEGREADRASLRRAQEELRRAQEEQTVARLVARRRAAANRDILACQADRARESEELADAYLEEAQAAANKREDDARRADADKRRRLMLDAAAGQVQQVLQRRDEVERARDDAVQERRAVEQRASEERQRQEEEQERKRLVVANQQKTLSRQVAEKRQNEVRKRRDEQDSVKALLSGWADEERRIQEAMAHPEDFVGRRFRGHR
jgi:hypothetical protein